MAYAVVKGLRRCAQNPARLRNGAKAGGRILGGSAQGMANEPNSRELQQFKRLPNRARARPGSLTAPPMAGRGQETESRRCMQSGNYVMMQEAVPESLVARQRCGQGDHLPVLDRGDRS